MCDDLIAGAKWTLENAAGMTLDNEEVRQLCDMADRIEELEAKLAKAVEFAEIVERIGHGALWDLARTTLAELTGGPDGD